MLTYSALILIVLFSVLQKRISIVLDAMRETTYDFYLARVQYFKGYYKVRNMF